MEQGTGEIKKCKSKDRGEEGKPRESDCLGRREGLIPCAKKFHPALFSRAKFSAKFFRKEVI